MSDPGRRSLFKSTFASIQASPEDVERGRVEKRQRGIEKIAYVSSLRATEAEVLATLKSDNLAAEAASGLRAMLPLASSRTRNRQAWTGIAKASVKELAAAGRALAAQRVGARATLQKLAKELVADHQELLRKQITSEAGAARSETPAPSPTRPTNDRALAADEAVPIPGNTSGANPWQPKLTDSPHASAAALSTTFGQALAWARVSSPKRANALAGAAQARLGVNTETFADVATADWDEVTDGIVGTDSDSEDWTDDLVDGFEERMRLEPIGRVHLERIDMTPTEIVRGELLHSVGLAPKESITLIHREWSSRETSFEKVISEEFEQSSEDGVTESTELASATEVQARHASELSVQAQASGSWGWGSASVTTGYTSSAEDESAKTESRNQSVAVTRKAASRTRKEHKTTFTVKETAGVEDQSVRSFSNPSDTEPMRIDFHQLLRKWKVDLYRHGIRLTYDIVVPAPGIDLLENLDEIRRIDHQLGQPFTFAPSPAAVTRDSWSRLAAQYGAQVDPPPPERQLMHLTLPFGDASEDQANRTRMEAFDFEVPLGHRVLRGEFAAYFHLDERGFFDVFHDPPQAVERLPGTDRYLLSYQSNLANLHGRSGRLSVVMVLFRVRAGYAQATLEVGPDAELWRSWQHAAWGAMRRAAEEQWQAQRTEFRQRRDQLGAAVAAWDPLSLRRMEREEIMKTTLKWIFGPAFDLVPSEILRLATNDGGIAKLEPARLSPEQWAQTMGHGEFIKYLHQAIEWENVLYFVYPYFWDNPRNHSLKRFLNHPDSIHRAFLRGGAARVVLTVRPGFEESFTRLFETGSVDEELAADNPYLTVAQELRAFAQTNYPGVPQSDDEEVVDAAERGVRIGRWYEYTPVSATDITVNTPLNELK